MAERPRVVGTAGDLEILDNADESRYEARLDGELAGVIEYTAREGWLVLVHTEVMAAFEGRGVAARLVTAALDDIRARSMYLTPTCPYVASFIKRHTEYRDLVVGVRGPRPR
jgi:predicted GNAT family acetyltransferase